MNTISPLIFSFWKRDDKEDLNIDETGNSKLKDNEV
jgi:hypothetical protein